MNQTEALQHLENMRLALQRYRSIIREELVNNPTTSLGFSEDFLAETYPWVFGKKCPLVALQAVIDNGRVSGQQFYNFMYVLHKFMPEVKVSAIVTANAQFPEPDTKWIAELGL